MKRIHYITAICVAVFATACNTLDVPPMNIITDAAVFGEKSGVTAYISKMYIDLPLYQDRPDGEGDIYFLGDGPQPSFGVSVPNYWNYSNIRNACYFIQEFPKYADAYDKVQANAWIGEAYFIRAFCHFRMAQGLGGIPIIDRVLNYPEETLEELSIPRSTEEECFDFILKDLDQAISLLPEESTAANGLERGRVNKYAALAAKARVAMHAAGVAKYGGANLQVWSNTEAVQKKLVGLPAARANEYFTTAWNASKAIVDGGKYSLHGEGLTDPAAIVKSYRALFQDKANKETIFGKFRLYPYNGILTDANCLPNQLGGGYSSHKGASIDFIKLFDDVDGNPIDWNERLGNDKNYTQHLFEDPAEAFDDLEPRFKAIILYPNSEYKNEKIEIRKGVLPASDQEFTMDSVRVTTNFSDKYEDITIQGLSGMGYSNSTGSGFYCVKFCNENLSRADAGASASRSEPLYSEFRYAETLLTLAEAAVELGRPADAVPYMNAIVKRAGSNKVFSAVTLDDVRKEWAKEFIWENKYVSCMYRWRTFHSSFDGFTPELMYPIYVYDKKGYYLRILNTGETHNLRITFDSRFYYIAFKPSSIATNPNIIQNPGH